MRCGFFILALFLFKNKGTALFIFIKNIKKFFIFNLQRGQSEMIAFVVFVWWHQNYYYLCGIIQNQTNHETNQTIKSKRWLLPAKRSFVA